MDMTKIDRRAFLALSAGSVAAMGISGCAVSDSALAGGKPKQKPNILWLSCEDIGPTFGCYGDPDAITPAIDAFSEEAIVYTRAFTVHGVCAPSRTGIITGMYPSSMGGCNMRSKAQIPDYIRCFPEYLRNEGYYCTNNSKEDYNFIKKGQPWDVSSRTAHWKDRAPGQPFFAVFNFTGTHESKLWSSAKLETTRPAPLTEDQWQDPDKITLPGLFPDLPESRRDWARNLENITSFDYTVKQQLQEIEDAGLADDTIVFIWSDHGVGLPRCKRWLYDSGTLSALLVHVPKALRKSIKFKPGKSDRLVNFIDFGPTLLNLIDIDIPDHMQGKPFLGKNSGTEAEFIFGARDRIDERHDMVRSVRDKRYRYLRNYYTWEPYFQNIAYMDKCNTMQQLRRLQAEGNTTEAISPFLAKTRPHEELYDCDSDPWEVKNLAGNPKYKKILGRLSRTMDEWIIEVRDVGFIPEPELQDIAENEGGRYEVLRFNGSEKLMKRLMAVARTAAISDPADKAQMIEDSADENASVRFWAVMGLGNLAKNGHNLTAMFKKRLKDPSPSVAIAAARGLIFAGRPKDTFTILRTYIIRDHTEQTKHFALEVAETMPDKEAAMFFKSIEKAKTSGYASRVFSALKAKYGS